MTGKDPKLVEIYRSNRLAAAHGMRMELESAGLKVFMDGELLQGGLGELPLGWATAVRVSVNETQADAAKELVKQFEARRQDTDQNQAADLNVCLACGQAMAENETRCTACGWTFLDVPQRNQRED